jgi:uncharacterized protein (DUF58 family)
MRPTGTGLAVAVSAVVLACAGIALHYPELLLFTAGCVAALLTALAWTARGRARLEAERRFVPAQPQVGEQVTVELTVENVDRRSSPELIAVDEVDGRRFEVFVPALAAGQRKQTRYAFAAARRGRLETGRLMVGAGDPLRLMAATRWAGQPDDLVVYPAWHAGVRPLTFAGPQDDEGTVSAASPTGGMAFHSLRDYRPGDSWRLINWRATAKRGGTLMVRHLVVPDETYQTLVLETDANAYQTDEQFEEAVRITASLAVGIRAAGLGLELITTDDRNSSVRLEPTEMRRAGGYQRALDLLAEVQRGKADFLSLPAVLKDVAFRPEGSVLGVVTGQLAHPVDHVSVPSNLPSPVPGEASAPTDEDAAGAAAARGERGAATHRERYLARLSDLRRFQGVYVVEVDAARPETDLATGVVHLAVKDSERFVQAWKPLTEK